MNNVKYRNIAKIEAESAKATIETPTKDGLRKSVRSSIGRSWRRSTKTKITNNTTAPVSSPTICALPQPSLLPRTRPKTSANSAAEKVSSPAQSIGAGSGSLLSLTMRMVTAIAARPIGRFT